jgi:protein-S-isoprenylcysteine O-methyltransferase Ste14
MKITSVGGLLLMMTAGIYFVLIHALFSPSPFVVAAQVAGVGLMALGAVYLRPPEFPWFGRSYRRGLVTSGPYRFIRHPVYAAACTICLAGILANILILSGA